MAFKINGNTVITDAEEVVASDLAVDTNTLYIDPVNNRVGIGTSSPATALHVVGGVSTARIEGTSTISSLSMKNSIGSSSIITLGDDLNFLTANNGNISFSPNSSAAVTVTGSGNVGVGTTSPSFELDVQSTTDPSIRIRSTGTASTDDTFLRSQIGGTTASNYVLFGDSANTLSGYIRYRHSDDNMIFATNDTAQVYIDSSGNVGIGTSSPTTKLEVEGVLTVKADASQTSSIINVIPNDTTFDSEVRLHTNTFGSYHILHNDGGFFRIGTRDSNPLELRTNDTPRLHITNVGNIGIGTTFPSTTLHVVGQLTIDDTVTGTMANFGSDNQNREISISGGRAIFGYSGSEVYIEGGASKGVGLRVNGSTTSTLSIDSAGVTSINGNTTFGGAIDETVHTLTTLGTVALDPSNGTIQTVVMSGDITFTDSFSAGESITLMIDDGSSSTITWPTITWVNNGGTAPTLATTGYTVIAVWKVGTTLYGALVGDGS